MVSAKRWGCETSLRGKQSTDAHRTCNKTCAMFQWRIFLSWKGKQLSQSLANKETEDILNFLFTC